MIPSSLAESIEAFAGKLGFYAVALDGSHEMAHQADDVCVIASVFKVPILIELYRQAGAGEIDLSERVIFEERYRVNGTGVLQELAAGAVLTVRDLAMLMMIVSDNVATDMLLDIVSIERVNRMLQEQALAQTQIRKNSKQLLYNVVGMDPDNPDHTYEENRHRVKSLELDPTANGLTVSGSNVSTPREMGQLLRRLAAGELMPPDATEDMLHILSRQNLNEMIPAKLPPGTRVAHKTGTLTLPTGSVRTNAGVVYHPENPFVLVCFSSELPSVLASVDHIATISRLVYDAYGGSAA